MKRILSLILAILLLLGSLTSCNAGRQILDGSPMSEVWNAFKVDLFGEKEKSFTQIPHMVFEPTGYDRAKGKLAYNQLETEDMRVAYDSIEASIYSIVDEKDEESGLYKTRSASVPNLNSLELFKVKQAVIQDHPEAFWLNGKYNIGHNNKDGVYVSLFSTVSGSEAHTKAQSFVAAVNLFFSDIERDSTEYEREKFIHDKLIRHCQYDYDAYGSDGSVYKPNAFSAYGALVDKLAVCEGYSVAAKLLFELVGIDSMTVSGMSKGQGHMWNVVKISDVWYQLDLTWDDPSTEDSSLDVMYWYFNIPDNYMKRDHEYGMEFSDITNNMVESGETTGFFNFELPECNSLEANFLIQEALPIIDLKYSTQRQITSYMEETVRKGENLMYFNIDESLDFNQALIWLVTGSDCVFDRCANLVNNTSVGPQIIKKKTFSFKQDDDTVLWKRIVVVELIYEE